MADNVPSVYGLIEFLWAKITEAGILDPVDYAGLTPIIPYKEVPLLMQAMDRQSGIKGFPYIVYAWSTNGYDQAWFVACDQIVFMINSWDTNKLNELIVLISNLFKRFDESAVALNAYIQNSALPQEYKDYEYKYTSVQAGMGGGPVMDENSPTEAMLTIRVEYTHQRDNVSLITPPVTP